MTDNWQSLGSITAGILDKFKPVPFNIELQPSLAEAIRREAAKTGHKPETIIAEAVRFYVGDAA